VASYILTKSRFISGYQCLKRLWLEQHQKDLLPEIGEVQQAVFDQGSAVGKLARLLFPGGELMPREIDKSLALTSRSKAPALFEATVLHNDVLVRVDVLKRAGKNWDLIEVKSSTSAKKEHIADIAVQKFVLEGAGFSVGKCFLMRLDNTYVRGKELEVEKLFAMDDLTSKVDKFLPDVPALVEEQIRVLAELGMPAVSIGGHCTSPYTCPFMGFCWKHMPENSVKSLPRLGWKKFEELYASGVIAAADIPDSFELNAKQRKYVSAVRLGKPVLDKKELQAFLYKLEYPVSFFDLETYAPAVPRYKGIRPYETVPFQYSLHVIRAPDAEMEHFEFLHDADTNPSEALVAQLLVDLPSKGSVVVFHQGFESARLKELERRVPSSADVLLKIRERFWDLEKPFVSGWYVDARFKGSSSIKAVLPVLVPELDYHELEVSDGRMAQLSYEKMILKGEDSLREPLLEYCKLDTLAMVRILEVLQKSLK